MAQIWDQNEEKGEDEELVVTEHRDKSEANVTPEEEQNVDGLEGEESKDPLEALGEDVASSPAKRGQQDLDAR